MKEITVEILYPNGRVEKRIIVADYTDLEDGRVTFFKEKDLICSFPSKAILINSVKDISEETLDFKLNRLLMDALVSKDKIKHPDSNTIAEFVTNWLNN